MGYPIWELSKNDIKVFEDGQENACNSLKSNFQK
jgi:hypothetical protein